MCILSSREDARKRHGAAIKYIRMANDVLSGGPYEENAGNSLVDVGQELPASASAPASSCLEPQLRALHPAPDPLTASPAKATDSDYSPTEVVAKSLSPAQESVAVVSPDAAGEGEGGPGGGQGTDELSPGLPGGEPVGAEQGKSARDIGTATSGGEPEEKAPPTAEAEGGGTESSGAGGQAGADVASPSAEEAGSEPDWSASRREEAGGDQEAATVTGELRQQVIVDWRQANAAEEQRGAEGGEEEAGGEEQGGGDSASGQQEAGAQEERNGEQGGQGSASSRQSQGDADATPLPESLRIYMERKGFATLRGEVNGMTVLHFAAEECNAEVAAHCCRLAPFLVNTQAAGPKCIRMSALHIAAQGTRPQHREARLQIVRDLVAARAYLEAKKDRDMTPFLVAAATANTPCLRLLHELRANIHAETSESCTAVNLAWANRASQEVLRHMGVRKGTGTPGSGRIG